MMRSTLLLLACLTLALINNWVWGG